MTTPTGFGPDPLAQFETWYEEAVRAGVPRPDAMTLATATRDGRPSARLVLYKGIDKGGVLFFTNYDSQKGRELLENPRAALVFYWAALDRQVRLEGPAERLSREESDRYFQTRPRGSQLGAWASRQSAVIPDRDVLERRVAELEAEYRGKRIPCPPFWGGFRLVPERVEFWIGQPDRLHDRFCYLREGGRWRVVRLSP